MNFKITPEIMSRFESKIWIHPNGCWKTNTTQRYASFFINGKTELAHRVSFYIYIGNIEYKKHVLHRCRNKCLNPSHLYIGTHKDNMKDRIEDGTSNIGFKHGKAIFNEKKVIEIRKNFKNIKGELSRLSKKYNCSRHTIRDIIFRRTWGHIK